MSDFSRIDKILRDSGRTAQQILDVAPPGSLNVDEFKYLESLAKGASAPEANAASGTAVKEIESPAKPVAPVFRDPMPEVPAVMKTKPQWVRWRLEIVNGRPTKVPYQVNGAKASSSDPNTWTDYETAATSAVINHEQGVGFMFADGFAGIDLDGCRNPKTGEITPWADDIIQSLDAYVEVSPSGTGLHIFMQARVPGTDKKFNLNPAIGIDGKAAIEVYDGHRYFTVTGESYFQDAGDVVACDLAEVYKKFHELRAANPAPRNERAESADAGDPTKATWHGTFHCSKYDIFKRGEILSPSQPFRISNGVGELEYPSQSEADLGFCTVLALMHDGDENKIWDEYTNSSMAREKWLNRKDDFLRLTAAKAIKSAKELKEREKNKALDLTSVATAVPASTQAAEIVGAPSNMTEPMEDEVIPPFDESVITGIFRDIVDLAAGGTTIPRQFPFLVAKAYIGSRMASSMTFEGMADASNIFGAAIGETGTSKDLSWERTMHGVLLPEALLDRKVKLFYSADSGAGLRDAFFDPPENYPVVLYVGEVRSLGHKAGEKKNPETLDTIIELANSHRLSRVKAAKGKGKAGKTHDHAYLTVYMCGQNGGAYMSSFPGRTDMGLWDRFYPEYSDPIEPGDLPEIDKSEVLKLLARLQQFQFSGRMTMGEGVKNALTSFWNQQPKDVKTKVRFKSHLMLDMYLAAWSQGRMVAMIEDLDLAICTFHRQIIIRRVHFRNEEPDRVGHYIGLLKMIAENMRKRLNAGMPMEKVAMSIRDFQTDTNAYRDNEIATFNIAWRNFHVDHLATVEVTAKNGHKYTKYVPMPYEDEMWCATPKAMEEAVQVPQA